MHIDEVDEKKEKIEDEYNVFSTSNAKNHFYEEEWNSEENTHLITKNK